MIHTGAGVFESVQYYLEKVDFIIPHTTSREIQ